MIQNKIYSFTLAETLITLVIIGVVAAITIPSMVNNFKETEYKTAYKKAFSIANQAWLSALNNNLLIERPTTNNGAATINNFNAFKSQFKVIKDCNNDNNAECWDPSGEKYSEYNMPASDALAFIDSSGVAWSISSQFSNPKIHIDTNGFKGPNKYGRDRFRVLEVNKDESMENGLAVKLIPEKDVINTTVNCPSGNCFYTSWLME